VITFKILKDLLKDGKDIGNDVIDTAKQSSTNLLYFVIVAMVLSLSGALGFSIYSKLDPFYNNIIVGILFSLFLIITLVSFWQMMKNPTKFIFNQNAFITVMREGLTDSNRQKAIYYTDSSPELNSIPPFELKEPEKKVKE
jgi:magnesium-transporting ATPase (P-type)